jgi:hypothetical protein
MPKVTESNTTSNVLPFAARFGKPSSGLVSWASDACQDSRPCQKCMPRMLGLEQTPAEMADQIKHLARLLAAGRQPPWPPRRSAQVLPFVPHGEAQQ